MRLLESFSSVVVWGLIPFLNFYYWFRVAQFHSKKVACEQGVDAILQPIHELLDEDCDHTEAQYHSKHVDEKTCSPSVSHEFDDPIIKLVPTAEFDKYRAERLAPINFPGGVLRFYHPTESQTLVAKRKDEKCQSMYTQFFHDKPHTCYAVVYAGGVNASYNMLRFDSDIDESGLSKESPNQAAVRERAENPALQFFPNIHNKEIPRATGYFRAVPRDRGRDRMYEKLNPFVRKFDGPNGIERTLDDLLQRNGFKAGDDIIVMVTNQGETDLYLNFACSCQQNGISMKNVLVFCGDQESVKMIESTGAMGIYHEGYAAVSKDASNDYLDRIFVDMMWYKAFSIYLVLRKGFNVLFQDVDLVWFKDPFPYFRDILAKDAERSRISGSPVEGFFSDDGQRSLRYAPFYANSGFYYLLANERSVHFAWEIMISFDFIQLLGSHQNVFTTKLIEGLSLGAHNTKMLSMEEFPTGIQYHHDLPYMERLRNHEVHPYNFHMCWTQGKKDKLSYLRKSLMWYLTDVCSPLEALTPRGEIFGMALEREGHDKEARWKHLSKLCCATMPGAPK